MKKNDTRKSRNFTLMSLFMSQWSIETSTNLKKYSKKLGLSKKVEKELFDLFRQLLEVALKKKSNKRIVDEHLEILGFLDGPDGVVMSPEFKKGTMQLDELVKKGFTKQTKH